ncbi:MAG: hypothetical protein IPN76_03800 [Saprospiraceae bacterium]|nr:hypothetical protein [Saprospiraceae bacterium]
MNTKPFISSGWFYTFFAVVMAAIIFYVGDELDSFTLIAGIGIVLFLAYKAYTCFRGEAPPKLTDLGEKPAETATVADHIAFHKKLIFIGGSILLFLSIWIIHDLNKLESGEIESVRIWAPIAMLYEILGYWAAVLIMPALCLFVVFANLRKIVGLKNAAGKV